MRLVSGVAVMAAGLWLAGKALLPAREGAWLFLAASLASAGAAFAAARPEAPERFSKVLMAVWLLAYPAGLWHEVMRVARTPLQGAIILAVAVIGPVLVGGACRPRSRRGGRK